MRSRFGTVLRSMCSWLLGALTSSSSSRVCSAEGLRGPVARGRGSCSHEHCWVVIGGWQQFLQLLSKHSCSTDACRMACVDTHWSEVMCMWIPAIYQGNA